MIMERDFSVEPTNARACGRKECNGVGCFRWFLDEGNFKLCPSGSWTYWLATIHEVAANGKKDHTRWILDWLVDVVRNPTAGSARPTTSLVINGEPGRGKSSIIWPIKQILYQYTHKCNTIEEALNGLSESFRLTGFNSYLEDAGLLVVDGIDWVDLRKLNELISKDTITIQRKGVNSYQVPNFIRLYAMLNKTWFVPNHNHRSVVFNASDRHQGDHEWFAKMREANLAELLDEIYGWIIKTDIGHNPQM